MELAFDRSQIRKNISMIVFKIIEYDGLGLVMHEFGTFIEKSGVVFVRFDNKKRGGCLSVFDDSQAGG